MRHAQRKTASEFMALVALLGLVWGIRAAAGPGTSVFFADPNQAGSAPENLCVAGDALYFAADDGVHGKELWRVDAAGRAHLVGDFRPGPEGSSPRNLVPMEERICFVGQRYLPVAHNVRDLVWSTTGTAAQSICVALPQSGQVDVDDVTTINYGGKLFGARTKRGLGRELCQIDVRVFWDVIPGDLGGIPKEQEYYEVLGDTLLFTVQHGGVSSRNFYTFNRYAAPDARGPTQLTGIGSLTFPIHCQRVGERVWFAGSAFQLGMELCVTDGTKAGTALVKDINPGTPDSMPKDFTAFRGIVYFQANDGKHGIELWRTDGTDEGTWMVSDINSGPWDSSPYLLRDIGSLLLFAATREGEGTELWCTDGTTAGTRLVMDIYPGGGNSNLYQPTAYKGSLLFAAEDPVYGEELWRSDGTPEGTRLIRDIRPGPEISEPYYLTLFNDEVYFCANDGVHGEELWRTDGTPDGTVLAADIRPNTRIVRSSNPTHLTAVGEGLYFAADDLIHGNELWWTDAASGDTRMVADLRPGIEPSDPEEITRYSDVVFFTADDGVLGRQLWRSSAPEHLETVNITGEKAATEPRLLIASETGFFFVASVDGGDTVFRVGEPQGDPIPINTGALTNVSNLRVQGDHLYICQWAGDHQFTFTVVNLADHGVNQVPLTLHETGSWETVLAAGRNANDGLGKTLLQCYLSLPGMKGRAAFFKNRWHFAARTREHGVEIWVAEGGVASAELLCDCYMGVGSGSPDEFMVAAGELFFVADRAGKGRELWTTDGTSRGTFIVSDWQGKSGSGAGPRGLTEHDRALYFNAPGAAWYGERRALTKTERTENGLYTVTVAEHDRHWPENPGEITGLGPWVYFAADHPATGRELWRFGIRHCKVEQNTFHDSVEYALVCNIGVEAGYEHDVEIGEHSWCIVH